MRKASRVALALLAGAFLTCAPAQAQLFRAYLASDGNDANPCTLLQPCRLLPRALAVVAGGGQVWMLDSANYNTSTVTIGSSVSILAVPGAVGSLVSTSGPAISVSALLSPTVSLRNLVIGPLPGSLAGGIEMLQAIGSASLSIENCVIEDVWGPGVLVSGSATLKLSDSVIRNVQDFAVSVQDGAQAEIWGARLVLNAGGVDASSASAGITRATVSDSVIASRNLGLSANSNAAGATARISITRSTIEGAWIAIEAEAVASSSALVVVGSSLIANNLYAWYVSGAAAEVRSYGNNQFIDNNSSIGALTPTPLQ